MMSAVAEADGERAAAAALADADARRPARAGPRAVASDSAIAHAWPRSSASMPGIRARRCRGSVTIGRPNFSARSHDAHRLAEALGVRRAEVAADVLLGVGALAMPEHHDAALAERAEAGEDRLVVAEGRSPCSSTTSVKSAST